MSNIQTVYIVGAGPGDPELLTLKGHRLLTDYAEVVLYDRLIGQGLLDFIPDSVEKIYAGKSCRKHHMTQEDINKELVSYAKTGKRVVRLKGGDPFIFGRGGEEAAHLKENNIPFEVVSGISSASGISALHGIPLTHRGVATSVRFITGHQQKGEPVELDWKGLANSETTLVVYMGLANLENIANKLMEHGLPAKTPVAVIENGTLAEEKYLVAELDKVAAMVKDAAFVPPTLVIIGNVVAIGQKLNQNL
jgi:uroporphyrin-III C-methyltransferase